MLRVFDNELLGSSWTQGNLPDGGSLRKFEFDVRDWLVCVCFCSVFGGKYPPKEWLEHPLSVKVPSSAWTLDL